MLLVVKLDGQISLDKSGRGGGGGGSGITATSSFSRRRDVANGEGADLDFVLGFSRPEFRLLLLLLLLRLIEKRPVGYSENQADTFLDEHDDEIGQRGSRRKLSYD